MVEDPEIFLHPQLQKTCSEILYRLSKKNQVIFKTHSPDLLFNFSIRQIRQVVLDDERYSVVRPRTNMSEILDDLGYGANDLLNVSFVFIVEGKQDKSRLPLLLEKHYSEIYDEKEICTAYPSSHKQLHKHQDICQLKYMNQVYLRDLPLRYAMETARIRRSWHRSCAGITMRGIWRTWTACRR